MFYKLLKRMTETETAAVARVLSVTMHSKVALPPPVNTVDALLGDAIAIPPLPETCDQA